MVEELERAEVTRAIDRAVEEMLDTAGIEGPPIDPIALAQRHLGMIICIDRRQKSRGRAQRVAGKKQIFLRPETSEERRQWTVAHEIGEHQKAALLERLGVEPGETRPMMGESLSNLFAQRLLVPSRWFAEDASDSGYDLLELKKRYRTASHEVIAFRLLDLPEPCIITVVDNGKVERRRSNGWRVKKKLEPVELECQRHVSEHGEPFALSRNGWTVQGWPVHQEGWKREILRSVVDEDFSV